jgi:hypothetical protein
VEGLRPHTHEERARIVDELVDLHRRQLGDNLLGLATQGSFAQARDGEYSDIELVAFLRTVPDWADCVQVWQGILIDIIWTTKDEYIARVKEVTPQWHLAGSDHLGTLINEPLIEEVNGYEPQDLTRKCLDEAVRHWPVTQEATGKVLNAVSRGNVSNLGRLLYALLDDVLAELAFLNARPYRSASTALDEARALGKLPRGFDDLASLAVEGRWDDLARVGSVVATVFAGLEKLFADEGVELYESEIVLRPVPAS